MIASAERTLKMILARNSALAARKSRTTNLPSSPREHVAPPLGTIDADFELLVSKTVSELIGVVLSQ
jgi:hypothetical protein